MREISKIMLKLYQEVTPTGKELLNKLVDAILFELEAVRHTLELEEEEKKNI